MNNIANVDTPEFKSQYITFEDELAKRLSAAKHGRTGARDAVRNAIEGTQLQFHTTRTETSRLDGNNVDMDQEQVELVRTTFEYQIMSNSVSKSLERLRSAAKTF